MGLALGFEYQGEVYCLCCAEEMALESRKPRLFWYVNWVGTFNENIQCRCGNILGSLVCVEARERIAKYLE